MLCLVLIRMREQSQDYPSNARRRFTRLAGVVWLKTTAWRLVMRTKKENTNSIVLGRTIIFVVSLIMLFSTDDTRLIFFVYFALYFTVVAIVKIERRIYGTAVLPERFRIFNIAVDWFWRGFKSHPVQNKD